MPWFEQVVTDALEREETGRQMADAIRLHAMELHKALWPLVEGKVALAENPSESPNTYVLHVPHVAVYLGRHGANPAHRQLMVYEEDEDADDHRGRLLILATDEGRSPVNYDDMELLTTLFDALLSDDGEATWAAWVAENYEDEGEEEVDDGDDDAVGEALDLDGEE